MGSFDLLSVFATEIGRLGIVIFVFWQGIKGLKESIKTIYEKLDNQKSSVNALQIDVSDLRRENLHLNEKIVDLKNDHLRDEKDTKKDMEKLRERIHAVEIYKKS